MKKIILFAIILSSALIACQRENSFISPGNTSGPTTLDQLKKASRASSEVFTISNAASQNITTSKGTKYYFPNNTFVNTDGSAVTGDVVISVREIITPQEMIFADMPTVSNGRLLESGGEYNITASQSGRLLKPGPGKFLRIQMPDAGVSMTGMQVFNGVADASGNVNWMPNNNQGNVVVGDSSLFSRGSLFCDSVNWINCDKLINDPTVEFTVYPGNAPSPDSTNVLVHLTGRNTVVKMNWTQGLSYFKSNMVLAIPSTIIGISSKNGQFYASVISSTIQNGQSLTLNFIPYSVEQLKAKLAQLR